MDNGNYNIEPIIRRIQETAFREGYEAGKKEAVKRGKWFHNDTPTFGNPYGSYICTLCNNIVDYKENYCPSCGADMRGENDA